MAGWIDRILRRREQRRYSAPYPLPGGSIAGMLSDYGTAIPAVRAHSVAAAASCISLIANCISAVPARIVLDSGEEAPQSAPAWRILRRPCATLSFKAYLNTTTRSLLETGNSLSLIVRDDRSAPRGLVPIPWGWVTPRVLAPGEIGFDITNKSAEAALLGIPARLMGEDAVHIVWASDDAITGRGPLQRSGAVFREALAVHEIAEATWRNGARPSLALVAPQYLNDAQRSRRQEFIDQMSGSFRSGKVVLIEGGWQIEKTSFSSVDAELLQSRMFSVSEICRAFNVPEVLLQMGNRSVTDMAPAISQLAQLCLRPICELIQDEFSYSLLPDGLRLSLDTDALSDGSFNLSLRLLL